MELKHTPGPWSCEGPYIFSTGGEWVVVADADVPQNSPTPGEEEIAANARLIAAAPDLLEALEIIFNSTWPNSCPPDWCDMMHSAIAKAKGESA